MSDTRTTLTEVRNGENVIPLRNAVCGIDMPYWCIDEANDNEKFLSGDAADKLAEYEKAEAEGRIVVLPCKVGAKVWFIKKDSVPDDDYRMSFHYEWTMGYVHFQLSMIEKLGKTMFLTREEAEQALKERRGRK